MLLTFVVCQELAVAECWGWMRPTQVNKMQADKKRIDKDMLKALIVQNKSEEMAKIRSNT